MKFFKKSVNTLLLQIIKNITPTAKLILINQFPSRANYVFRVKTTDPNKCWVVKFFTQKKKYILESHIVDFLQNRTTIGPSAVAFGDFEVGNIKGFLLMPYIRGKLLSEMINMLQTKELGKLFFSIGQSIATFHMLGSTFTNRSACSNLKCNFEIPVVKSYLEKARNYYDECISLKIPDRNLASSALNYIEIYAGFLRSNSSMCLLHSDLLPNNIIVKKQCNHWQFHKILDFDEVRIGDYEFDFAKLYMSIFSRYPNLEKPFEEGYSNLMPLSPAHELRKKLYRLIVGLGILRYAFRFGNKNYYGEGIELITHALSDFGRIR